MQITATISRGQSISVTALTRPYNQYIRYGIYKRSYIVTKTTLTPACARVKSSGSATVYDTAAGTVRA
ncbi:hypothetical protein [Actinomadura sp. 9N215]|uniref:hypothetical protein n=1 Tax=Actinomadura sp. 9N215 TaxID=3375150 RepID=UPI00379C076E